jgi:hypothetical protein
MFINQHFSFAVTVPIISKCTTFKSSNQIIKNQDHSKTWPAQDAIANIFAHTHQGHFLRLGYFNPKSIHYSPYKISARTKSVSRGDSLTKF